ncbi:MAG TPA: DUF2771 family protein [Pseudonocardiaceae bacterium]
MRRGSAALLAATGFLLASCATSPSAPEVTFYAAGKSVRVGPAQYCDAELNDCTVSARSLAVLRVPPGRPLQISVPGSVAEAPWQVVFRYRLPNGERVDARSSVFRPGEQYAYTLRLPDDGAQLETAEVHQFAAVLLESENGAFEVPVRATWVLSVDDLPVEQ